MIHQNLKKMVRYFIFKILKLHELTQSIWIAQKLIFFIKDLLSKCEQNFSFLRFF